MTDQKKLISLEESNNLSKAAYEKKNPPVQNGIACPKCQAELWDPTPAQLFNGAPPQVSTKCESCKFETTRYVNQ